MFENLTLPHLLMVLVIAMLLFGTKRIPEIAGSMGKGIREFKKNISDVANDARPSSQPADPNQLAAGSLATTQPPGEPRGEPKRLI